MGDLVHVMFCAGVCYMLGPCDNLVNCCGRPKRGYRMYISGCSGNKPQVSLRQPEESADQSLASFVCIFGLR